jgi:hypothetical protein
MVIGCFAEVVHELGAPSIKYAGVLLPLIQAGLADPMEPVRRNSAFCLGTFVAATGTALKDHMMQVQLTHLLVALVSLLPLTSLIFLIPLS